MDGRVAKLATGLALALCALACAATSAEAATPRAAHRAPRAAHRAPRAAHRAPRAAHRAPRAAREASSTALLGGVNVVGVGYATPLSAADGAIAQARALHAKVVRTEVPWAVLEPTGPGAIAPAPLAFANRLMGDAAAAGIRVILDVDDTPCWVSSAPTALLAHCSAFGGDGANAWPPSEPAAYAAFVAYLASRYGSELAAIEVWNEPDQSNEDYFAGPDKAERYVALLRAAYPAIKAVDPSLPVLGGSIVGSNGAFLRLLYEKGMQGYYDGLSVHYYTLTLAAVRAIHEVQLANGDTKPLWLNEFGWTSCLPRSIEQEQACVTPQIQAVNLGNTFRALAHSSYVAAAVAYKLQDSSEESFGMLSQGGARKPSFKAVAGALANPFGPISGVTLRLRRRGASVIASGSAPVGDYMRLEVFRGKLLRYWQVFTLNRYNDYSIALPSVLGTHGLRVRVYQYWSGQAKAAQKKI
jgi:hypothetical protein